MDEADAYRKGAVTDWWVLAAGKVIYQDWESNQAMHKGLMSSKCRLHCAMIGKGLCVAREAE